MILVLGCALLAQNGAHVEAHLVITDDRILHIFTHITPLSLLMKNEALNDSLSVQSEQLSG